MKLGKVKLFAKKAAEAYEKNKDFDEVKKILIEGAQYYSDRIMGAINGTGRPNLMLVAIALETAYNQVMAELDPTELGALIELKNAYRVETISMKIPVPMEGIIDDD